MSNLKKITLLKSDITDHKKLNVPRYIVKTNTVGVYLNEDKNAILSMILCVKDVDEFKKAPGVIQMTDIGPDTKTDGHIVTARIKQGSLQELENDSNVISYEHSQRVSLAQAEIVNFDVPKRRMNI